MPIVLNGEVTATALDKIMDAISAALKLSGDMLTYMVDNPIYVFYLACGFIGIGLAIFSQIRGTARG